MSYIDEFLEINTNLPRDLIRLLKLVREIDEKAYNSQILLETKRNNMKNQMKSKNKIDKNDLDLQSQLSLIEKENEKIINLHDHKIELLKECNYLIDYHLNKTNEIIKNYEKFVQINILNGTLSLNEEKPDKSNQFLEEQSHQTTSKKRLYESNTSSKNAKIITDSMNNDSISNSKFSKKKKVRPSKSSKIEKDEGEITSNNYEYPTNPQETLEEEKYCICNRVSFGDMIGCDNEYCNKGQWFHFECMKIETRPKGRWYCSKECENMSKKKKK